MNFEVKGLFVDPGKVIKIEPEIIANQKVGSRIELSVPHDLTVEFSNGSLTVEGIDLIIYVMPQEFFCYAKDELAVKFNMDTRAMQIDLRPAVGNTSPRIILRSRN